MQKTQQLPSAAQQHAVMARESYTHLVSLGAVLCGVQKFYLTFGLVVNLKECSYERRYCFEFEHDAVASLQAWDGQGHPGGPWIKCKGAGIDLLNPNLRQ